MARKTMPCAWVVFAGLSLLLFFIVAYTREEAWSAVVLRDAGQAPTLAPTSEEGILRSIGAASESRPLDVPTRAPGPKVVYAVFSSKPPKYRIKLETMLETWAMKPRSEGRFFAIVGEGYPRHWLIPGCVMIVDCPDSTNGLPCKETHLIQEGVRRDADWLFVTGEDNWINTEALENALRTRRPHDEVGLGCLGCGTGQKQFCSEVQRIGGLCGGCGYALSRAALDHLLRGGAGALESEYGRESRWPNDMRTSCALRSRGVRLDRLPNLVGGPMFGKMNFVRAMSNGILVFHYVTPSVMRWLHGVQTKSPAEDVDRLERLAFDQGCAIGMNTTHWTRQYSACLEQHMAAGPKK
eukprot:CAMPEP_0117502610 /NCGR_PEP_ID=MMETSP0784-20121206/23900_1 /TAXON_ID=39447 /ORGANISM="" /LENGTH=352 /DNA_ID=CAMNT_0005297895 /DNA_START=80 /DNA_END=1135 /DNA_ORIENTATION=-